MFRYFFQRYPNRLCSILLLSALSLTNVGCQPLKLLGLRSDSIELQLAVTQTAPGTYTIVGDTNLPENTRVAVAAVRYLSLKQEQLPAPATKPTYSILAYQTAQVSNGQWQAQLNLWHVGPNGQYQEAWQAEQAQLKLSLQPQPEVLFLAMLNPGSEVDQLPLLEKRLREKKLRLDGKLVYTTPEGQQYILVRQNQTIALPVGQTRPPTLPPEAENGGWGRRYLMPGEPQNPYLLEAPTARKTDAPYRRDEFLR